MGRLLCYIELSLKKKELRQAKESEWICELMSILEFYKKFRSGLSAYGGILSVF